MLPHGIMVAMRNKLTTESRNPNAQFIDRLSSIELVRFINDEDARVASAVRSQENAIAHAIDTIVEKIGGGGRLLYIGAGTSGRLGVLDASECPPTFSTAPELVVGIIAGGPGALVRSSEGAEDVAGLAKRDLQEHNLQSSDVLVGIASSGRTPYVLEAIQYANSLGCRTIIRSCNENVELDTKADIDITPVVGAEIIAGSTRMKAGTATKMILNMLTTGSMIRLGKTYGDLMVDLRATNNKLLDRAIRIVQSLTGLEERQAADLLEKCDGEVKTAVVVNKLSCSPDVARQKLKQSNGFLRRVLAGD